MDRFEGVDTDCHPYMILSGIGKAKTDIPCALFLRLLAICEPDFDFTDKVFLSYGSFEFAKAICFLGGTCDVFITEAEQFREKANAFMEHSSWNDFIRAMKLDEKSAKFAHYMKEKSQEESTETSSDWESM
ncbi:uncharacterized protein SPPG_05376 [Spizellomyces punctatus DAOM BR117]|uniref:Uncharacterized protein n=1 Tax=Spizellomyces punctatus (strain DAOM BR117) TaxID=645134 RepID=A0A0L0HDB7_SPIPD|nr:uncharacterized protein SPPG_05376 [Spizellomyces punctatus DAOM BR117]KNC99117.1 hypothetical protein SPPG_05376 [Spizellomyces punctatus DAOM BR117]|eukprot:XP_016607157.1 hypothetical protein SPPG_05376 [Spizellomyces punctatus DAOM BR117]